MVICAGKTRKCLRAGAGGVEDPPRGPLELWVADTATGKARKLLGGLNTVFDECAASHLCTQLHGCIHNARSCYAAFLRAGRCC